MAMYYQIAGLSVEMDTFGRTEAQAKQYAANFGKADIVVSSNWPRLRSRYPELSDDDGEYVFTGADFYRKLLEFDGLLLHSSAVVLDGNAYLFTADSGTGKSTHTQLWLTAFGNRAYILNDDKPAVRLENDIWYAYGTPWSGKTDMSVNARIPIRGIAVLERSDSNWLEPLDKKEAFIELFHQTSRPKEMEYRARIMELFDKLICMVPLWKLHCNMDPDAAVVAYETMSGKRTEEKV